MRVHIKQKFPCGYEIDMNVRAHRVSFDEEDIGICPMHGKNCKRDANSVRGEKDE